MGNLIQICTQRIITKSIILYFYLFKRNAWACISYCVWYVTAYNYLQRLYFNLYELSLLIYLNWQCQCRKRTTKCGTCAQPYTKKCHHQACSSHLVIRVANLRGTHHTYIRYVSIRKRKEKHNYYVCSIRFKPFRIYE